MSHTLLTATSSLAQITVLSCANYRARLQSNGFTLSESAALFGHTEQSPSNVVTQLCDAYVLQSSFQNVVIHKAAA